MPISKKEPPCNRSAATSAAPRIGRSNASASTASFSNVSRLLPKNFSPKSVRTPVVSILIRLRSEEHTSELQSQSNLVCRLLLEKKKLRAHHHVRPPPVVLTLLSTTASLTASFPV